MTRVRTSKMASSCGLHISRFLRPMWKKERRSLSLTWGWRSWKQFLIFFRMSGLSCETMDPPVQESLEVPEVGGSQGVRVARVGVRVARVGVRVARVGVRVGGRGATGNRAPLGCPAECRRVGDGGK